MEAESVSDRPESPKKKMKSNTSADSEAQSSAYSECDRSGDSEFYSLLDVSLIIL